MALTLSSSAIMDGGEIPRIYTREGRDLSPPLAWSGVPEGTETLALIVEDPDAPDPDAPERIFTHWVLFNLPWEAAGLPESVGGQDLPDGTCVGTNDWGERAYGGPEPPRGRHRYFFRLLALDTELPRDVALTRQELEQLMDGHILDEAVLLGTYEKAASRAA